MDVTPDARDLLGAYALDAIDDDEVAAVERLVATDLDAASELHRLRGAAAWIGATEALVPPRDLRAQLLARAQTVPADVHLYRTAVARHEELLDSLDGAALDAPTANGLTVGDLVVHLAAMESAVAETVGHERTLTDERDVDRRTRAYLAEFGDDALGRGRELWRAASAAIATWAETGGEDRGGDGAGRGTLPWTGVAVDRRTLLATRSFELWTHDDDIRVALGRDRVDPAPREVAVMSDVAVGILPACLSARGWSGSGTARIVLTGAGGGDWCISLDGGEPAEPVVTLTMDVIDYCRLVADRIPAGECPATIEGDARLGRALVESASALATL